MNTPFFLAVCRGAAGAPRFCAAGGAFLAGLAAPLAEAARRAFSLKSPARRQGIKPFAPPPRDTKKLKNGAPFLVPASLENCVNGGRNGYI
ncbi:MAG: hypothetical protein LBR16_03725 [Treponema sp.]|nr:hypothetical protein [Treponema sp.]